MSIRRTSYCKARSVAVKGIVIFMLVRLGNIRTARLGVSCGGVFIRDAGGFVIASSVCGARGCIRTIGELKGEADLLVLDVSILERSIEEDY